MDSYHQTHPYMRAPPLPSSADPYHHHHQHSPLRPPVPPQSPWFPNQFQYHPPPPPPPPGSYPPPPHPYPSQPIHHTQFPPPRPPMFPPPPPHAQMNQEWNNRNWAPHQGWDYQAHSNEEDWAARARAWADAKTAMESQQSQFAPTGRLEEQNYYHDQYSQPVNSNYSEISHQSLPPAGYEQFKASATPVAQLPAAHHPESAPVGSEPSSYISDANPAYSVLHHHGNLPPSPSVHRQEVPSSNYPVAGKEDIVDPNVQAYKSLPLQNSSVPEGQQHFRPSVSAPYAPGNDSADPTVNLADQPLDFAPRFNHDHGLRMQSGYARTDSAGSTRGIDSGVTMPSLNPWTSITPGMVYPPIPPVLSSGTQLDPSVAVPSSVPLHPPRPFGRFPAAAAPFAGTALPATVLSSDTYGISNVSERPKKAPVPNWLREEIKKAVITSSSGGHRKEETELMEDQGVDKSFGKGDQTDSRSVDSSKSSEEDEEDDEDSSEEARTAAINQEIKRLLTEVLKKVTDELFDEIATKVLKEDDPAVEVTVASNQNISPSSFLASTPKSSAKVLIPAKVQEPFNDATSEKSSSSSPGDVLGLGNYASDDENNDDKDDEIQSSNVQISKSNVDTEPSSIKRILENPQDAAHTVVEQSGNTFSKTDAGQTSSINDMSNSRDTNRLNDDRVNGEMGQEYSLKSNSRSKDNFIKLGGGTASGSRYTLGTVSGRSGENVNGKKGSKVPQDEEAKTISDNIGRQENMKVSQQDHFKEGEVNIRSKEKTDENRRKQDERHPRKDVTDDHIQKEKLKDQGVKPGEKDKDTELRHRSTRHNLKEERREDKIVRASGKDGTDRKKEYTKDKEEGRSRQKISSDSSRHKSSKDRNKGKTVDHLTNSSEDSDDSRRKVSSRRRDKSPSPVRSKRRQVSRSPHSKHSQRRHSPFSSLETTRARRSRSRSPVRRRR